MNETVVATFIGSTIGATLGILISIANTMVTNDSDYI